MFKFVTVHNKCPNIPLSTSMQFGTRVRRSRVVRLSRSSRFYMRAAASKMRAQNSSRVSIFFLTWLFIQPHKQKSNGVGSGRFRQLHFGSYELHFDSWRIRDQLDVTSYYVLFHFFYAQHVSDINMSIIRSLRLFYCITTLVVCSCFGVAVLGWYPCSSLLHGYHPNTATPKQEHMTNVVIQ